MAMKKQKLSTKDVLMQFRIEIFRGVIYDFHAKMLSRNSNYLKAYCKTTKIPEKIMLQILNGTYDGKLDEFVEMLMKVGQAPIIEYKKTRN